MKKLIVLCLMAIAVFYGCTKKEVSKADNSWEKVKEKGVFILGFDESFPPMGFKSEGDFVGFDIDLAREAAARLGVKLELQPIIWDVKEQELNTGKIDCIWNGFSMTPEREEKLTFTKPYMDNKQIVIVNENSNINSLTDLSGKKLAIQRDSSAMDVLNKRDDIKSSLGELLQFEDNVMAMADLDTGNSDAVLMDIVVANYNYTSKFPGKYRILDETLASEQFGIAFRKGDVALKDKIEQTLKEMAEDGTMAKISEKWFGADITTINQ